MDRGPGTATEGSFMSLSENEQRCYSGLHTLCQADSSGKLAASKVGELFRASQLPSETLHQVTEVCGAKRLGYFGSVQFYVALKLLAAAQSGLPIHLESIRSELPLPRFLGMKDEAEVRHPNHSQTSAALCQAFGAGSESVLQVAVDRGAFRHHENSGEKKEPWSPPRSPSSSPPDSPSRATPTAYHSYTYSVQRNGADLHAESQAPRGPGWPVAQLENSSPSHYGAKPSPEHIPGAQCVERLVDHSTADYPDDPWRITEEQREYYTHQFKGLQPDLGALILGTVAKNFFTKSKLPIPELSHIWELSDVDRDGALTLPEFCTAFHLIVARKNGYPLPETLPTTLLPGFVEQDAAPVNCGKEGAFLAQQKDPALSEKTEPLIVFEETERELTLQTQTEIQAAPPEVTTSKQDLREEPSAFSPKRAAAAAAQGKLTERLDIVTEKPDPPQELDLHTRSRARPRSYSSTSIDDAMKKAEEPPTPPPRPQKTHSRASSLDLTKLFQQSSQGFRSGWLAHPPALPPRPLPTQLLPSTEKGPQKAVQQTHFADFSRFREEPVLPEENGLRADKLPKVAASSEEAAPTKTEVGTPQAPPKPVRRKLRPGSQNLEPAQLPCTLPAPCTPGTKPTQRLSSRQKKDIQMAIRKNKETNAVLVRLNSELQQQLKEVHQERVSLESQLEILRPVPCI